MQKQFSLPQADRVGILIASILLTYAITQIIRSPQMTLTIELPGFYFAYPLTIGTGMTMLAAALSAAGMRWLMSGIQTEVSPIEHLILPTLTTFVLGGFLQLLSGAAAWWVGLAFSGILLMGVFLAEYITVDAASPLYGFARAGLTALAYALFLITAASLRFSGLRMFLLAPAIFFVAGLISLRILHLDGADRWDFPWATGIGIVCMQIGAGLHYWGITPLQYGLGLTGPLYALTMLSSSLAENTPLPRASINPAVIIISAWIAAALIK